MIVSIDIGTSYSSISMLGPDGKAQPVDIGTGASMFGSKHSLPSAVFVEEDGRLLLGQAALNNRMRKPQNFRDEFKRDLGERIPVLLGERQFLPEELYTEFFRHMKQCAERVGGGTVEFAYLTCPATYGKGKRELLGKAASAAGLFQYELVDEPTAAAMNYCAAGFVQDGQNLLIYDFGGGTFDAAVIRYEEGSFTSLTEPQGLERCGGVDIDRLILQDMLGQVDPATLEQMRNNEMYYRRFMSHLSELAVRCKHQLSTPGVESVQEDIQVGFDIVPYELPRVRFEGMIAGLVGETIQVCRRTVKDAGLTMEQLSSVLLVGGTSRVCLVREMVEQMVGTAPVYSAVDLELAVAQGALNYRNYRVQSETDVSEQELMAARGALISSLKQQLHMRQQQELMAARGALIFSLRQYLHMRQQKEEMKQQRISVQDIYHEAVCLKVRQREYHELMRVAAEKGHMGAQHSMGNDYHFGWGGVSQDYVEAAKWYCKAAEQGHIDAQYELARMYKNGKGVSPDCFEAARWYHKAAEQGHMDAQYELARMYKNGKGVSPDCFEAARWYHKAAEQGHMDAQYELGRAYQIGSGVVKSEYIAKEWYRKAAEQGHTLALESLGLVGIAKSILNGFFGIKLKP